MDINLILSGLLLLLGCFFIFQDVRNYLKFVAGYKEFFKSNECKIYRTTRYAILIYALFVIFLIVMAIILDNLMIRLTLTATALLALSQMIDSYIKHFIVIGNHSYYYVDRVTKFKSVNKITIAQGRFKKSNITFFNEPALEIVTSMAVIIQNAIKANKKNPN
ncbi:MAG: hypothetical protein WBO70_07560 [Erysipelotrichaceae bacterium]